MTPTELHGTAIGWPEVKRLLNAMREGISEVELKRLLAQLEYAGADDEATRVVQELNEHLEALASQRQLDAVLRDTALELVGKHDRQAVLSAIVRKARALLGSDMAYISLNDFERQETYIHTVDGVVTSAYRAIRMPFGSGVLGVAAHADMPTQSSDYLSDETLTRLPDVDSAVAQEGVHAILGAPLRADGRVIGALLVADRHGHSFSAASVDMLNSMAALAAVAIETTQLIDELNGSLAKLNASQQETRRYVAELEHLERADSTLMTALASMEGVPRLQRDLSSLTSSEVAVLTAEDLRSASTALGALDNASLVRLATGSAAVGDPVSAPATLGDTSRVVTVMAAVVNAQILGAVCTVSDSAEPERILLQRAAMTLTAQMLFERAIADADTREQSELLEYLITVDAATPDPGTLRRLAGFGIKPGEPVGVVVIASEDRDASLGIVTRLVGRNGLAASHSGHVCALVSSTTAIQAGEQFVAELKRSGVRASAGCVDAKGPLTEIAGAHRRALAVSRALDMLGRQGEAASDTTMGSAGLILGNADYGLAQAIVLGTLGPLLDYDRRFQTELVLTAATYLDSNANIARCAAGLHYHPNTVRQRLERIDQLLGSDWRNGSRALDLHLALRLWQFLQWHLVPSTDAIAPVRGPETAPEPLTGTRRGQ